MPAATPRRCRRAGRRLIASKLGLRLASGIALAVVGLAVGATASFGDVSGSTAGRSGVFVGTFEDHGTFTNDPVTEDYPCFVGQGATVTGTDDVFGRFNNTVDFFHFTGTLTTTYRIDFPDGRYVLGRYVEHQGTQANAESGVGRSTDSYTSQDRATVYSADGQPIGTATVHSTFHIRVTDGEVTMFVDRFRVSCP